ncbi:unnamed protein product, partial [Ranitomeya imitator]
MFCSRSRLRLMLLRLEQGLFCRKESSDGSVMKPCAFFSRKFSPAERNYDVGNRELLAMKWAFEEWRHWLEGAKHHVVVLTDHKNLTYLESAKRLNPRQARWSLFFFSRFDFVVSYLPGSKNVKADALSRSFVPDSLGLSEPVGILKEWVESSDCPGVDTVVDRLQQIWTHVVDNLTLFQEKAQRFTNRRRCVGPRLRVGDLVWLSSRYIPMKVSSPKFKPRFIGPYRISEVLNPVSFRLTLPASLLRRYVAPVVPSVDPPAPVLVEGELEYIVEKILDSRISRRKLQYLVKWKGYGQEDNSWVFASDVHAADLVRAFHLAHPGRPGSSGEGSVTPPQGAGTVVNSVVKLPPVVMSGTSAGSVYELPLVDVSGAAASEFPSSVKLLPVKSLTLQNVTTGTIRAHWTSVRGATGYRLTWSSTEGFDQNVNLADSYTQYLIQGLHADTEYTVTINPIFVDIEGPVVSAKALTSTNPQKNLDQNLQYLMHIFSSGCPHEFIGRDRPRQLALNSTLTSFELKNLVHNTEYVISLYVLFGSAVGPGISTTVRTSPLGYVSNFKVTGYTSSSISLAWSSTTGATEYKVSWNPATSDTPISHYLAPNIRSYHITNLQSNTRYIVNVQAIYTNTEGPPATLIQSTDSNPVQLLPIKDLQIVDTGVNTLKLSWKKTPGITHYKISWVPFD